MIIHKSFGLDLGTTNSTASIVKNGKVIYAEEGKAKNKTIPSIVAVRKNGQEVVGSVAKIEFYSRNPDSKKSIKRDMGKNIKVSIGEKQFSPEEISSRIISYCKECLIETIGEEKNVVYDNVVITVPAYFNLAQKDATRKAGELAGLNVQMLLEEPSAAAINYAVKNNVENGLFLVFDLGGGTFDVSILEKTGAVPSVLATSGNNFLGGDNFDFILARYFLEYLKEVGFELDDVEVDINNNSFRRLIFAAENVKKELSKAETYSIDFTDVFKDNSGVDLQIEDFSREQFNNLIKDKVEIDIIKECDKALEILKEKYNKTIEDVTHILLVGGSTKIPFIQETIRNKYCITDKLKDVICFESDLSVSAGAAFVANSNGFTIEDKEMDILVEMNSPYLIEGEIYLTGKVLKGNLKTISVTSGSLKKDAEVDCDNCFMLTIPENEYKDTCTYTFVDNDDSKKEITNDDNSTADIIAPTPIQNEDISVTIIDVERGKPEEFIIVPKGANLPYEAKEVFKLNEYSRDQIILPIWEGPRKIFNLIIDLPSKSTIGSKIEVVTHVDMVSNVTLDVELNGEKLSGRYEYIYQNVIDADKVETIDKQFEKRIEYVEDETEKTKLFEEKETIKRELNEARENNDENHYSTVSERYEKIVSDMPSTPVLTDEHFDKVSEEIKGMLSSDFKITEFDVDNLCFYGKRFLKKGNMEEAQKCMDELLQMKRTIELFNSPKGLLDNAKLAAAQCVVFAENYCKSPFANESVVANIAKELELNLDEINEIFEKYDENDNVPEMKEDAMRLLHLTSGLFNIMQSVAPHETVENESMFKGLVSKA